MLGERVAQEAIAAARQTLGSPGPTPTPPPPPHNATRRREPPRLARSHSGARRPGQPRASGADAARAILTEGSFPLFPFLLADGPPSSVRLRQRDGAGKSLGGVRSSEVRKLLAQKFQQENETIHQLQAMSFDFRFAKAEEYYYQRYQEMMTEEAWKYKVVPKWEFKVEEKRSQSAKTEDAKKWDYLVSERELNHIEKHICRVERARGLRDHNYRLLPQRIPREILCPKILTLEKDEKNENIQKTPKTETRRHKVAWAKEQMKGHQDRMIRGRELTEQRNDQREAQKLSSYVPPFLKSQARKAEAKEFEWVTAYPIFQPYQKALLEVTILMEKSKKEDTIKKPLKRELLSMPPFLRSQLEKNKV
nr:uncharacterized protein LOC105880326 isoform X1 [Microcebus murinus]